MMSRTALLTALAATLGVASVPALAQRDPAYAAARAAGQVGEQPDGYLGIVGPGSTELRALVSNINIQRKAKYTESAQANGATVEEMAFTSGCNLIAQTQSGEKYRGPDGVWKTRSAAEPTRDTRCG
jgi:uncharacterized protein YdbL (DUF1318 family)